MLDGVQHGILVVHVFRMNDPSTFQELKKTYRKLTQLFYKDKNEWNYKVKLQIIAQAFQIVSKYFEKRKN